jgi:hypothetical protein
VHCCAKCVPAEAASGRSLWLKRRKVEDPWPLDMGEDKRRDERQRECM